MDGDKWLRIEVLPEVHKDDGGFHTHFTDLDSGMIKQTFSNL